MNTEQLEKTPGSSTDSKAPDNKKIKTAWARVGITFKDTPEVRKFLDCRGELGFQKLDSKSTLVIF